MPSQNRRTERITLGHCCLISSLSDSARVFPNSRSSSLCRPGPSGRDHRVCAKQKVLALPACGENAQVQESPILQNCQRQPQSRGAKTSAETLLLSWFDASHLIQWRSPSIFLLKIERTEFELTFSTSEDAAKAVVLVKTNFPQVQETWTINS